jgi:curli biogenesis system outer membrane secretion channel CsgG
MILIFLLSNSSLILAYEKEIRGISSNLSENIAKVGKKMIAVVDFTDLQGNVTELGRFLAEEFSVAFAGAGKGFEVVDRTHLKSILAEHKLSATGIMDPQTARKLGQIAGVDALVTGTITPFGDSIRVSVKILDTSTARVIGASSGDIAKTKAIEELLARGIDTGTRESTTTPPPTSPVRKGVETSGFILSPLKCFRKIDALQCTISFQNTGNEQVSLRITPKNSHLVDNHGNKYPVRISIGEKVDQQWPIQEEFLPQIPVNLHFLSKDVVPTANHITAVISISRHEQRGHVSGWSREKLVGVRNIPITK